MNNFINPINQELLIRFLAGEADEAEHLTVERWVNADADNKKYFDDMLLLWEAAASGTDVNLINIEEDWQKVQEKIIGRPAATVRLLKHGYHRLLYQFTRIAVMLILCVGLYFVYQSVIKPQAPLLTAVTRLKQSKIRLPDGSTVYLNRNSKLTYPQEFGKETREVTLEGEAFFEVVKHAEKPFLIHCRQTVTKVVGTSFNINSRDAAKVEVTVATGKVTLSGGDATIALSPGEQGTYTAGTGLSKVLNPDINFLSWKTGVLVFQNTPVPAVAKTLSHYFGKNIQVAQANLQGCTLTSRFQQQSLEEVLAEMQLLLSLKANLNGNLVILTGEACNPTR